MCGKGSLRGLAYGDAVTQKKAVYALVCETLKCTPLPQRVCKHIHTRERAHCGCEDREIILQIMNDSGLLREQKMVSGCV